MVNPRLNPRLNPQLDPIGPEMDLDEDILRHMGMLHAGVQRAAPLHDVNVSEMGLPLNGVQRIHDSTCDATQGSQLADPFSADEQGPQGVSF